MSSGRRTSASAAGVFAEAYWAWGWWGVVIFMPIYGIILGTLTGFASNVMHDSRWLYFPIVLLGLRMGFRTDGHYISDVAGAGVILIGTYGILYILERFLKPIAHKRVKRLN